ncbi:MAG: (4Fe-4S)-binding protein [Bacteroidota bacterium]|nr:(4Fe-4S)-binding protein [Bacteroidota bacterium]MDP4226458.1 (4Fe-4S)-binding protein [Bacteroidota bacterium]MDP4273806.1 (4Fe-4S)-binding protein [Bacteroidota bacterium]
MNKIIKKYTNGEITVVWQPHLCNHSGICFTQLLNVFNPRRRPWVDMTAASTQDIIKTVDDCPTMALSYSWNDQTKNQKSENDRNTQPQTTEIRYLKGGPLMVQGNFDLVDCRGIKLDHGTIISICRCGASKNMPYCDGSHNKINFDQ